MAPKTPFEDPDATFPEHQPRRGTRSVIAMLLLLPVLAVLAIPLYSRDTPRLAGLPFFYWYQFACVPLTAVSLTAAPLLAGRQRDLTAGARTPC